MYMSSSLRFSAFLALAMAVTTPVLAKDKTPTVSATEQQTLPDWYRRGLPGPAHAALEPLVGLWRVQLEFHAVLGRSPAEPPLVSNDIICKRTWVGGGRYLEDTTEGTFNGSPYWRKGWLGYSNMDKRYEWVTIDSTNSNMMIYLGKPGSGADRPLSLMGVFTDQGVIAEAFAGKSVPMRTEINIESDQRHTFDLYFTPPGQAEVLAVRKIYTRIGK
jgi:hypothetical protein